jgi:hypothetical protein
MGLQLAIRGTVAVACFQLPAAARLLMVVVVRVVAQPQLMLVDRRCLAAVAAMQRSQAPGQQGAAGRLVAALKAVEVLLVAATMVEAKTSHLAVVKASHSAPSQAATAAAVLAGVLRTPALLAAA